jgi:hypothetical protein
MDSLAGRADHSWVRDLEVDPEAEKNFPNRTTRPVSASPCPQLSSICTRSQPTEKTSLFIVTVTWGSSACDLARVIWSPPLSLDIRTAHIDLDSQKSHLRCLVFPTQVKSGHYVPVLPTPLPNPKLIIVSRTMAAELGEQPPAPPPMRRRSPRKRFSYEKQSMPKHRHGLHTLNAHGRIRCG